MTEGLSSLPADQQAALRDLPPSAKLVCLALLHRSELTQKQLAAETLLSPRTTRHALNELEAVDIVDSRVSFMDARQRLYSLPAVADTRSKPFASTTE